MAVSTLLKFMAQTPLPLVLRMNKTLKEFFRAGFISTALAEGIYDIMAEGPASQGTYAPGEEGTATRKVSLPGWRWG